MKRTGIFLFIFILSFAAGVMPAKANLLEFLFPSLRNDGPDPSQTLTAPFAAPKTTTPAVPGAPMPAAPAVLPENKTPLDAPHKTSEQVSEWVEMAVSEALTFTEVDYRQSLAAMAPLFNAEGKSQFEAFLQSSNFTKILESNRYYIRGFVKERPLLMNEGAVAGRYHWLYDVQMMVTYMDRSMQDYKNATPISQLVTVRTQVGRSGDAAPGKDLVIEQWSGKIQNVAKK